MLHSPLFYAWTGWVLVIGVIAVVRGVYARRDNAERERRREERASRRVGRTEHSTRQLSRPAPLPPG